MNRASAPSEVTPIKELRPGQNNLSMEFIVLELEEPRVVNNDGLEVRSIKVADQTGSVDFSLFGEPGKLLQPGDVVRVNRAYTHVFKDALTLRVSKNWGELYKIDEFCFLFSEEPNMSRTAAAPVPEPESMSMPIPEPASSFFEILPTSGGRDQHDPAEGKVRRSLLLGEGNQEGSQDGFVKRKVGFRGRGIRRGKRWPRYGPPGLHVDQNQNHGRGGKKTGWDLHDGGNKSFFWGQEEQRGGNRATTVGGHPTPADPQQMQVKINRKEKGESSSTDKGGSLEEENPSGGHQREVALQQVEAPPTMPPISFQNTTANKVKQDKQFRCNHCGAKFTQKKHYLFHLNVFHKKVIWKGRFRRGSSGSLSPPPLN